MKIIGIIAAIAVIAASTHANIAHLGGYHNEGAPLAIALSVLLAVGIAYATIAWKEGQRVMAVMLGLCIVAGEAYWLATTAEREISAREMQAMPAREAAKRYSTALRRFEDAKEAKRLADEAAVSEAAKPGCRKNCADLLKDAKDRAATELGSATVALAGLPAPMSSSPLPDRLGVASWAWDLILACLRSAAVIGASIALAVAMHPKRVYVSPSESEYVGVGASPRVTREELTPKPSQIKALPAKTPPKELTLKTNVIPIRGGVVAFLASRTEKAAGANLSLNELFRAYKAWCAEGGAEAVEAEQFIRTVSAAFEKHGIVAEPDGTGIVCRGLRLSA
jgi:hypothetical protein